MMDGQFSGAYQCTSPLSLGFTQRIPPGYFLTQYWNRKSPDVYQKESFMKFTGRSFTDVFHHVLVIRGYGL